MAASTDHPPTTSALRRCRSRATPAFSPLYQQIKGLILQSLQAGEWKPGEAIPSEMELAARFRVSQGTVRKAIDELAAENLVVRRQGKGTFVATHAEQHVAATASCSWCPTAATARGPAQRSILDCRRCARRAEVARAAAAAHRRPGRAGAARAGLRRRARPSWKTSGCPAQPFKGLTAEQLAGYQGPIYALFEIDSACAWCAPRKRSARWPPTRSRPHCSAWRRARRCCRVERLSYTYNDVPMELRRGLYRTDTHHYRND